MKEKKKKTNNRTNEQSMPNEPGKNSTSAIDLVTQQEPMMKMDEKKI